MNKTTRDLTMTIRALKRILETGKATVAAADQLKYEISNDSSRSDEWKRDKTEAAQREQNANLRKLGAMARPLIDDLMQQAETARNSFDYRDPDFTKAVAIVGAMKNALPFGMATGIADSFAGNYGALKALKALYQANGIDIGHVEALIQPLDGLGVDDSEAVTEFIGYACSDMISANEWRTNGLAAMLDKYEKGFALDTSISPYMRELVSLKDDPRILPAVKDRVTSWIKYHGEALETDDPREIAMTENRLNTWKTANETGNEDLL